MKNIRENRSKYRMRAGQSLVEYALIIGLVGLVSITGLNLLGGNISTQINKLAQAIGQATGGGGSMAITAPVTPSSPVSTNTNGGASAPIVATVQPTTPSTGTPTPAMPPVATPTPPNPQTQSNVIPQEAAQPVTDAQQGATLNCNGGAGSDPRCAGSVDVGSQWGW
jgi:Flp pilus assembly pilin Flp